MLASLKLTEMLSLVSSLEGVERVSVLCGLVLFFLAAMAAHSANVRTAGPSPGSIRGGSVTLLEDGRIVAVSSGFVAIWDPEQQRWDVPRDAQGQIRRYLHTSTKVGKDRVVFAGGLDPNGNQNGPHTALSSVTFWRSDLSTWEQGPSLLGPRFAHAAVALPGGDVLIIGGATSADREQPYGTFLASVEKVSEKTTTTAAPMAVARARHTATMLPDGRVVVVGGIGNDRSMLSSVELYDSKGNKWQAGPSLVTPRAGHTATLLPDGRVLIAGGADADGNPVSGTEVLAADGKSWSDAGDLLAPRHQHAATLLKDGRVLISGGLSFGTRPARTLETWDPAKGQWDVAGEVAPELREHHAVLMPNGSVLLFGSDSYNYDNPVLVWLPDEPEDQQLDAVIGASITDLEDGRVLLVGGSRRQSASASASIYDLKTNRWVSTSPLHFARSRHQAIRLDDGRVLVGGGIVEDRRSARRSTGEGSSESLVPAGEIWNPATNRWTVTDDVSALADAPPESDPDPDMASIAQDTPWAGTLGILNAADGKTYAFRTANLPGHNFPRLGVMWLNTQARRWQPNTDDYVERDSPAILALSDSEIMVAGGASAVVQIFNTSTNRWRQTGWLPAAVNAPSILYLRDGGVMLAGRIVDKEDTVLCALWSVETSIWTECGRFTSDSQRERHAPVLRDLGSGQTLLVHGNEQALVRGADGTWTATKLDFPKESGWPNSSEEGVAYTTDLGSVWNPLEQRWVDATDVLMIHRHGLRGARTADRRWIFASRTNLLQWQPQERIFSRLSVMMAPERDFDTVMPIDAGCAVLWNGSREGFSGDRSNRFVPRVYARNFTDNKWTSATDAPTSPIRASAYSRKGNTLFLAGASRDLFAGGDAWRQYQVACDKVAALTPAGSAPSVPHYLPTRPVSAPKQSALAAGAGKSAPVELSYLETWQATARGFFDSARNHIQGTLVFTALFLVLIMRLATQWGHYHTDENGHAPGRVIDLVVLGVSVCVLIAALGLPWAWARTTATVIAASAIVFAAKRLWSNIESPRERVLYGVPLGAGALTCGLVMGALIIGRLAAIIDELRDY